MDHKTKTMNPFLTITTILPADPSNNIPELEKKGKYLPGQFIGYVDGPTENTMFIYLMGGQVIYCRINMVDLEEMLRQYWVKIANASFKSSKIVTLGGMPAGKH